MNIDVEQPLSGKKIALFATCLVDLLRPSIGFATLKILEDEGLTVSIPEVQVCCGQPGYNNGDRTSTIHTAKKIISELEPFDYIVIPSGSCAGMIKHHYPKLLDETQWHEAAVNLAERTFELTQFLLHVVKIKQLPSADQNKKIAIHDSCAGMRELNIKDEPRQLLSLINGVSIEEHSRAEDCCGFGGTFCVKYPDISNQMVTKKTESLLATGADTIVAGDLGCLLNIAGKLSRVDAQVEVRHIAEILAGSDKLASIGAGKKS